uniref:NADH dehydrogenase subunit 8 n=1 Tax=Sulcionema specki TaxID=2016126 RepID=A0A6G5ZU17_9EUGL|nr:NADH dehydrogenase subunit 8 [Sulcionema specki]
MDVLQILSSHLAMYGSHSIHVHGISYNALLRGDHVLTTYSDGTIRCIVCRLCSTICPASAISITTGLTHSSIRYCIEYSVCHSRCIYCGWCDVVCPVWCITETTSTNGVVVTRYALLLTVDQLVLS